MKRFIAIFMFAIISLTSASCTGDIENSSETPMETLPTTQSTDRTATPSPSQTPSQTNTPEPTPKPPFDGKIGIITFDRAYQSNEWRTALPVVDKYGEDKVVHVTWPNVLSELGQMMDVVENFSKDTSIESIIVNQAIPGTDAIFRQLKETRKNIFLVYCQSQENVADITQTADLIMITDERGMGPAIVQQAQEFGATAFIHYSFPRHMSQTLLNERRERIRKECFKLGIEFVDRETPDPAEVSLMDVEQFILEDVTKMVAMYGKNAAFFCTSCAMQESLVKTVVEQGAIYPSPCHPSPSHGFLQALSVDIEKQAPSIDYIKSQTKIALTKAGMIGRFATWPTEDCYIYTFTAAEYAIKRLNGEVPQEGIDIAVLTQLMTDYAGVQVYLTPYTDPETDTTYDNYLMMRMDYITFE